MVQSKAKNIVVSSSPSPSPLPSPRSAAPVARGQQQRAVKRSQPDNGAVRPYKKRMSRVVEDEETDEEDGGVPLPQEEEEEEEIAAGVAAAAAAAADDDDEDGGVLLDDGLGDDDYDDDEDCVDLEELDLNQLISQAELAELVDEETDEDEVSVPARARAPSVRTPGSSRPYSVIYDVEEYSALDLGPSALPEWFATMSSAEKQAGIQRARQMWIQYFEKTKKQADAFDFSNPDPDFPFSKGMVVTLRSGAWTAGKLADFVLSGKDEYGKYLDGLARLPTGGELKAIRAPTPEQLQGILVYTDLIERRQIEYRYGGSGTSRKDGASRLRQYELAKRLVMSGKSEEPKMDILSHMNVLLQKDSEAFWRLRASFSHATTTPKMVLLAEAAMIDFERTMSKDVPLAGTKSQWARMHSLSMLNHSKARFPDSKSSRRAFVGLNRASPYKQGLSSITNGLHRLAIFNAAGMQCSCCQRVLLRSSETNVKMLHRLSWEAGFFYEGVTTMCGPCVQRWHRSPDQSPEDFLSERRAFRRRQNLLDALKASEEVPFCCICNRAIEDYKRNGKVKMCTLVGYIDRPECPSCSTNWHQRHKKSERAAAENDPVAIQAFVEFRTRGEGGKGVSREEYYGRGKTENVCVVCQEDATDHPRRCPLQDHPDSHWCQDCYDSHRRSLPKRAEDRTREWERAWFQKRSTFCASRKAFAHLGDNCVVCGDDTTKRTGRTYCSLAGYTGAWWCGNCRAHHSKYAKANGRTPAGDADWFQTRQTKMAARVVNADGSKQKGSRWR